MTPQRPNVNFIGNLQAVDNSGNSSTDISLKSDVSGLTSLAIANSSTTAANLTSTANGNFTTGAGTGFYYGGATGSLVGANTISSTGIFTGTLFALTADSTTSGTILGISGQSLATGKAIDVSLGAAYNLAADAKGTAGAVNVRAGAYNGNIFNVLSTANTGASTMNLANLQSGQTDGQLLKILTTGAYAGGVGTGIVNIDANTATGGTIARITATGLTGSSSQGLSIALGSGSSATGILVNTGATYTGNLVDLQANSVSQFKVDASNTTIGGNAIVGGNATVAGSLLGSNGTSFSIDETGARPINIGTTTATTINIGRATQNTLVGGSLTSTSTFVVGPGTPNQFQVSSSSGAVTAQGVGTFGPNPGNQLTVQGAATGSGVQIGSAGTSDANVAISIAPKGTGRVKVAGASGGLDVDNTIVAGAAQTNSLTLAGSATTVPLSVTASGVDTNVTIQITPKGSGSVQVNGTGGLIGPATAALLIDSGANTQQITIGGTNATQVDIARSGVLTRLLGNATVGGTLGVTGDLSVNTNKFNVTALTGAVAFAGDLNIATGKFTVASATGNTVIGGTLIGNNATGFLIDASGTQPISIGTTTGTAGVTISRTGQLTTVAGNAQVSGTFKLASTGTALNEMRFGTCTIANTSITSGVSVKTNCTIVGGNQDLSAYEVTMMPTTTPPNNLIWTIDTPSTTQLVIRWANTTGVAINSTALTFRWFAVR